jgi:hypothetical protein
MKALARPSFMIGERSDRAAVEPRMHAVAVVFDFVQPLVADRRHVDQLRELRRNPLRERGGIIASLARYGTRHAGRGNGLQQRCMRFVAPTKVRGSNDAEGSEFRQQVCQTISWFVSSQRTVSEISSLVGFNAGSSP